MRRTRNPNPAGLSGVSPCPECGGSGKVMLLTSSRPCGRCGGAGGVDAVTNSGAVDPPDCVRTFDERRRLIRASGSACGPFRTPITAIDVGHWWLQTPTLEGENLMLMNASAGAAFMPWFLAAPPAVGAALALWIARQSAGGRGLPGCGAGSGCDAVTRSRWSKWIGIPVAAPAAILYLIVLASFVLLAGSRSERYRHIATDALLAAAPQLATAAVWFVGLQWLLLRRFYLYCLLLHGIGVTVAGLVALGLAGGAFRFAYAGLPAGELLLVLSISAAGSVARVLGQVMVKPRTFTVQAVVSCQLPVASNAEATILMDLPAPAPTLPSPGVPGEGKNGRGDGSSPLTTGNSQLATIALNPYLHGARKEDTTRICSGRIAGLSSSQIELCPLFLTLINPLYHR